MNDVFFAPPVIVDTYTADCFMKAVHQITSVVMIEIAQSSDYEYIQNWIALRWPVYFTSEQQEAILIRYAELLMREK